MWAGHENCAEVPVPSALPAAPLPAIVPTKPEGRILRSRLFVQSQTNTLAKESTVTPRRRLKAAAAPTPSAKAGLPEPAKVVTAPVGVMRRTRLLKSSPTYRLSEAGSTDTPTGKLNAATVPCPSAHPAAPLPASVLTFQ